MENIYKHTFQIKQGKGLRITNFTIDKIKLLNLINYKISGKTTLKNPYKTNLHPFPQVGNLVG